MHFWDGVEMHYTKLEHNNLEETNRAAKKFCPSCGSQAISVFYELTDVPVHSVLLMTTQKMAISYPRGDIVLGFCQTCGFISNLAFDPGMHEYSSNYEETQGFSSVFTAFHKRLATYLVDRYDLRNKNIIEIGCGKGEFLTLLCELGDNHGVGFDPAYISERNYSKVKDRIRFIKDFYSEKYARYKGDFICCKMTLEHIQMTADFLSTVRRSIGDRAETVVFFQVPDVSRILSNCAFEDIYYEHCSYFSPGSLARLFRKCSFDVVDIWTDYEDQYVMIEARPGDGLSTPLLPQEEDMGRLNSGVLHFVETHQQKLDTWKQKLNAFRQKGRKVVLWGSGSKGVAFLTTLNISSEVEYVVDINPYRQGFFMAGTGHKIISPEFLKVYKPDVVIVMNPVYRDEIQQKLENMSVTAEIMTL